MRSRKSFLVLGTPIDALDWSVAIERIAGWAARRESRCVAICNAHSLVTARSDAVFASAIRQADMATADGAPVAWMLRRLGNPGQARINGPDLMWRYCAQAAARKEAIFLYGSTPQTLEALQQRLLAQFPGLRIAGAIAPPFRPLTAAEDEAHVQAINAAGAGTLWVGLGCPRQEKWMAAHQGRINAVMIGVGAAFDYHAASLRRAPLWMQHHGLEWSYRLLTEPRRLWKRYLLTNTQFVLLAAAQLLSCSRSKEH